MRQFPFHLGPDNRTIIVEPNEHLYESHALIYFSTMHGFNSYIVRLRDNGDVSAKNYPAPQFKHIHVSQYAELTLEPMFNGIGSATGSIFLGSWGEMLLKEIEFSMDRFHVNYDPYNQNIFVIGIPESSNIEVKHDGNGNYRVIATIASWPSQSVSIPSLFRSDTDEVQQLATVYEMIRNRMSSPGFMERQNFNRRNLTEHLERRIRDEEEITS